MWFNNFHSHYTINSRSLTIFSDFNKSGREVSPSDHLFLKLYTGRFSSKKRKNKLVHLQMIHAKFTNFQTFFIKVTLVVGQEISVEPNKVREQDLQWHEHNLHARAFQHCKLRKDGIQNVHTLNIYSLKDFTCQKHSLQLPHKQER